MKPGMTAFGVGENHVMFRILTAKEEKRFRRWARKNYKPGNNILEIWHPVVQDECNKINEEHIRMCFARNINHVDGFPFGKVE